MEQQVVQPVVTDDGGPDPHETAAPRLVIPTPVPVRPDAKPGDPDWDLDYSHPARNHVEVLDFDRAHIRLTCADGTPCKKVAIVGFSPSTRDLAPLTDPSWSIWGLNQLSRWLQITTPQGLYPGRSDLWFETHDRDIYTADIVRGTDYVKWLQTAQLPIMMLRRDPDMPTAVRYPIEAAIDWIGRDYLQSSIAYMLVYAALLGAEEIGIWGVDLIASDNEYQFEKPNLEYLIGRAEAKGIKVTIPEGSALLKQRFRYGQKPPDQGPINPTTVSNRVKELLERRNTVLTELNHLDGILGEYQMLNHVLTLHQRGGLVVTNTKPSSLG